MAAVSLIMRCLKRSVTILELYFTILNRKIYLLYHLAVENLWSLLSSVIVMIII